MSSRSSLSRSSADPSPAPGGRTGQTGRADLVVSIINYRTGDLTIACIRSVLEDLAATPDLDAHVIVVDNASGDGSAEEIAAWLEKDAADAPVSLVRSDTNSGFSGGHNQGMAAREADFYLILNSDAVLRPGFFAALMAAVHAAPPGTGLFAPRIESEDGIAQTSFFRFFSPASELVRGAETGLVTRLLTRHEVPLGHDPDPSQIGWASFACILLRGAMVEALGSMDEGYFLYFEDAEYCWRAAQAGWHIQPVPAARAVHYQGGSGPVEALSAARKRLPAYYYASRTRFFRQARGRPGPFLANLAWHAGRAIAHLRPLTGRRVPRARQGEARDIWTNVWQPLGDRRAPPP